MDLNPYQTPAPDSAQLKRSAPLWSRLVAVGCWLSSLFPVVAFLSVVNHPGLAERRAQHLLLFVVVNIVAFALPTIGLAVLGTASWRRSRRLALAGAAAFLPIFLWTMAALFWPR
jgi:hypothetical protein